MTANGSVADVSVQLKAHTVPAPGPPLITPAQDQMSTVRLKRRLLLSPGCGRISKRRGSSRRPVPVTKTRDVGARLRQPWLQDHPLAEAVSDAEPWCVGGDEVPMWDADSAGTTAQRPPRR
jgi:hypothetical protein